MQGHGVIAGCFLALLLASCGGVRIGTGLGSSGSGSKLIDHKSANVDGLTSSRLAAAKSALAIAYWHTSHGSQLVDGMASMDAFYGGAGSYSLGGSEGLRLDDHYGPYDLGAPDRTAFDQVTRDYLAANPGTNVVLWSWCGEASTATEADIEEYLSRMSRLESDFPGVAFVYMTGHADGSGPSDNLRLRNDQIRAYCKSKAAYLYDFNDIESYDPDGAYYGDKSVTDGCDYDSDGDGVQDANWAQAWQDAHPGQWWDCGSAHSLPLNANLKAKAAWQLWVAIAERI